MVKLAFATAVFDDFASLYHTIQALRMYHGSIIDEYVVVDNHPSSRQGEMTADLCAKLGLKYVPLPSPIGTSPPRDLAIRMATSDYVLVADSHVLFMPSSLARLKAWLSENDPFDGMVHAVLLYDNLDRRGTMAKFLDCWRGQMWGVWAHDPRVEDPENDAFDIQGSGLGAFVVRRNTWLGFHPLQRGFGGEEMYIHEKYRRAGRRVVCLPGFEYVHRFGREAPPYRPLLYDKVINYVLELMELGVPLERCRRHFVEGIEEQPPDEKHPVVWTTKVQPPLDAATWDEIVANPVAFQMRLHDSQRERNPQEPVPPTHKRYGAAVPGGKAIEDQQEVDQPAEQPQGGKCCGGGEVKRYELRNFNDWREFLLSHGPFADVLPDIESFGKTADGIAVYGLRDAYGVMATLSSLGPAYLVLTNEQDRRLSETFRFLMGEEIGGRKSSQPYEGPKPAIVEQDSPLTAYRVFIGACENSDCLRAGLQYALSVQAQEILVLVGRPFFDGGVLREAQEPAPAALVEFLRDHAEWAVKSKVFHDVSIMYHLSRALVDKKKIVPGLARRLWNFGEAVVRHIASGAEDAPEDVVEERLNICAVCDFRSDDRCTKCGCYLVHPTLKGKAVWAKESCPLGRWLR